MSTAIADAVETGTKFVALRCAAIAASLCVAPAAHALPADAQAQIVAPVSVTNGRDLDFGRIIAGSVNSRVMIPAGSDSITVSSGNAVTAGGAVTRARFDVVAPPLTLAIITLPTNIQLTRVAGTEQMLLDQFQQNGAAIRLIGLSGQLSFFVGGRLHVALAQATGRYEGTFNVTVNFL